MKNVLDLFRRTRTENDIREELQFHIEQQTAANVAAGMTPDDALSAARREFGSVATAEEACRDAHGYPFLATVFDDVRFGLRLLRKSPSFAITVIATLAVAIAANTAMFSIVYGVLLRPIDLRDSDRVYALFETSQGERNAVSPPDFLDWRAQSPSFSAMAAYTIESQNLGGASAERLTTAFVTGDFIDATGIGPIAGRPFAPADLVRGAAPVALVASRIAEREFGSAAAAVGKSILLDGVHTTIAGVMPRGYTFPRTTQVWLPLTFSPKEATQRGAHWLRVIARLAPHATSEQASRELASIGVHLAALYPRTNEGGGAAMMQLQALMVEQSRKGLLLLLAAVGLLAVIACVNVGNLLLSRVSARVQETAIRTALGATRARLLRQYLTESFVLAMAGGAVGTVLALGALRLIVRFGPRDIPRLDGVTLDVKSLLFTAAVTAAATMLFGIAPALKLSRSGLAAGKRVIGRRGAARGRTILACSELALAVTLATGAALLVRSFVSVAGVDNGFDPRNIVTFSVALPSATYPDTAHVNVYYDEMVGRLAAIPGARAAGSVEPFALGGDGYSSSVAIGSGPDSKSGTDVRLIDAGYLRALRIPVIRGVGFDGRENVSTEHVMLVNREAARRFWPNGDPIGSTVKLGASLGYEQLKGRVIGMVGDVRDGGPESEIAPMIYVPVRQAGISIMTFVVRTGVPASAMIESVRREAAAVDRGVAIGDLSTLDRSLADSISRRRFQTVLLGAFAATALLLACIGVYGVVAESVMQRYHEIGIRMALGASPSSVFIRLMSNASTIVVASVAIGIVVAVLFRRVVSSMLFGVSATDPATLGAVAISVAVVSVIAAAVPARRATLVDPVVALRQE